MHNYLKNFKKPTLLAIQASRKDKISQFKLHKMYERDREKFKNVLVDRQNVPIYL